MWKETLIHLEGTCKRAVLQSAPEASPRKVEEMEGDHRAPCQASSSRAQGHECRQRNHRALSELQGLQEVPYHHERGEGKRE